MDKNELLKVRGIPLQNEFGVNNVNNTRVDRADSPLDKLVFSKNQFGWPSNDIEFKEHSSNAEVRQALERRQMPIPSVKGEVDDDLVLDTMPINCESIDEYSDRLNEFVNSARDELMTNVD